MVTERQKLTIIKYQNKCKKKIFVKGYIYKPFPESMMNKWLNLPYVTVGLRKSTAIFCIK